MSTKVINNEISQGGELNINKGNVTYAEYKNGSMDSTDAKIAGEMVSLTATETNISKLCPQSSHAIVAIPDAKKGEQLILMTTSGSLKRAEISAFFKENQISELSVLKEIIVVEKLPLLGTGKVDYVRVRELVC